MAANVHGKSQFHSGNFLDCVSSFKIFHPDHGELTCSPTQENTDLFHLTLGGFGLTGHITEATLKLERKKGNAVIVERIPVTNIMEAVDLLRDKAAAYDYIYSWHNLMRRGRRFGKGIVFAERFSKQQIAPKKLDNDLSANRSVTPISAFNAFTMPVVNQIYEWKEQAVGKTQVADIHSATFPIHGKEFYFALMGKKGFLEYQLIIPFAYVKNFLESLAKLIARENLPVSLGSLKVFKGRPRYIQFCAEGICLAIDVPFSQKAFQFFTAIDKMAIANQCIINISKDSRVNANILEATFPEYDMFRKALKKWDPKKRFTSGLREQLDL